MEETLRSVRSFEQFVLLSVVELSHTDETPAHSYDVTETVKRRLNDIQRDPFGGVERREVISALGSLAEDGFLAKAETESAVGKGRPAYDLATDDESLLEELAGADGVGSYAETLQADAKR